MPRAQLNQRDTVRKLLDELGYNEASVCAAYAQAEPDGLVQRYRNVSGYTPEGYARAVWRDGHRQSGPWILEYCRSHRIKV